jgi:MoaA/NifB/PqqE/SkfB family radical SAM enzyme
LTLHYTTNATIFPDNSWLELWKQFKEVEIQLSIDGIGQRFEYIRYPASWEIVSTNALKYLEIQNIKLSISTTVSAYNIAYLDELFSWAKQNGLPKPYLGRVHNPSHLRPTVWKDNAKQFIIDKLRGSNFDFGAFVNLLQNENDSHLFDDFRYRLLRHDQYRNLSFKNTFPELFTFLSD